MICRHGLHQGIMAFILEKSTATMQRIFIGWVIFLATIFNEIELKPTSGFLLQKMPKSFVETGHGLTDLVIDATEFKFQSASNFELNSIMFSNYKNTQTGKALIGISPHFCYNSTIFNIFFPTTAKLEIGPRRMNLANITSFNEPNFSSSWEKISM